MAKFRSNHERGKYSVVGGSVKLGLALILLVLLFFITRPLIGRFFEIGSPEQYQEKAATDVYFLPVSKGVDVYRHHHFYLGYDEEMEQAAWVAYELTTTQLNAKKVSRTDFFSEDPIIESGSSHYEDYRGSGYTKGHLVPAADRAFSREAMDETFLMSNISPQEYHFNSGIWRELEELTRDWARSNEQLYIYAGPIFPKKGIKRIGRNQVAVPEAFYKILVDASEPDMKGIGFIVPNTSSEEPLTRYMVTIDAVEDIVGINFNSQLFTSSLEDSIESKFNQYDWPIDQVRFKKRIEEWNRR